MGERSRYLLIAFPEYFTPHSMSERDDQANGQDRERVEKRVEAEDAAEYDKL